MDKPYYSKAIWPIIISIIFAGGFYIGRYNSTSGSVGSFSNLNSSNNKINQIIDYIDQEYVDSTDKTSIVDETIQHILQKLDPHSYYISAAEVKRMNEPLEGSFDGIGVQFSIQKDTIVIVSPVEGGPSEKLGIQSGDRIVEIDSQVVAGTGITNSDVMKALKGPAGTKVKVGIRRGRNEELIDYDITRGAIPIYSVDAKSMVTDSIGYIKVSRFAKTTYEEFVTASEELKVKGMTKLILDLRGNGGGFMDAAIKMADEFLPKSKLIVYTKGRSRPTQEYFATNNGTLENMEVVVLIDEGSASASEIVAGALQDNDKGTIIGRRSFGKGLVQEQSSWPDGSATRLTIARYYTPTGRCIQRPYESGTKKYNEEIYERYETGEITLGDSIPVSDSLKYTTPGGRTVYGGGGIMPDIFVPMDTVGGSYYLSHLYYGSVIYQFCFDYADENRNDLLKYKSPEAYVSDFAIDINIEKDFLLFANKSGVPFDEKGYKRSKDIIHTRLKAGIGRNIFGNEAYYPIVLQMDSTFKKAKESLSL